MVLANHLKFSIDMGIVILTNQKKYLLTFFVVLATVAVFFFVSVGVFYLYILHESDLGNGHNFIFSRGDNMHIRKDGTIVVRPTIIDRNTVSEYVVGLRLPAEHLKCDGGGYKIRLKNKKEYFVLLTRNGDVFNYISRDEFEVRLKELGIFNDVSLHYTQFETVWNQYSNYYNDIDYSACVPIEYK